MLVVEGGVEERGARRENPAGSSLLCLARKLAGDFSPWRMKTPITSWPCSMSRWAATLESTPPLMANTTRDILRVYGCERRAASMASSRRGLNTYNSRRKRLNRKPREKDLSAVESLAAQLESRGGVTAWKKNISIAPRRFAKASSNFETLFDWETRSLASRPSTPRWPSPISGTTRSGPRRPSRSGSRSRPSITPLDDALKSSDDLAAMIEMAAEDESFAAEVPGEVAAPRRRCSSSSS